MKFFAVLFSFLMILLLSGCATSNSMQNNLSAVRMPGPYYANEKSNEQRAQDMKENIMKIEELEGASVVIEGNSALIGLRMKQQNATQTEKIKKEAARLAREADDEIISTAITSNDEIISMIEKMERKK